MMFNLNKRFQPQSFNKSPADNILITPEKKISVVYHRPENKHSYENFNDQFGLFLSKLPNNNVKRYVHNLYNKKIIFMGDVQGNDNNEIFARVLLTNNKLSGVVLNKDNLDIDLHTGDTNRIDDCIYATYFGLIRAAILTNSSKIRSDKDLHKLLTTYLYLMFIKIIGKNSIFSKKQKDILHLVCIYIYHICFFNEKHTYVLSIIKRDYKDVTNKEIFDEFFEMINDNKGYSNIKDIPKLLIDLKLYFKDPKQSYMTMIQMLKPIGFYTFVGPLDQFIASMILTKYPTDLFSRNGVTNQKIHDSVEDIICKYISKLSYEIKGIPSS